MPTWEIFHVFLLAAVFNQNQLFRKILSVGIPSGYKLCTKAILADNTIGDLLNKLSPKIAQQIVYLARQLQRNFDLCCT